MDYVLKYSKRKTLAIRVNRQLEIIVYAPLGLSRSRLHTFLKNNVAWIEQQKQKQAAYNLAHPEPSREELALLRNHAKAYLPDRVAYYAKVMQLYPASIKITSAKTRFGSCSGKNGLCFSLYLMRYPKSAIDYVVVHELAHIAHKNHSKDFYAVIASILPDYKERKKLLKQ